MPIIHSTAPDGSFSPEGKRAWSAEHSLPDASEVPFTPSGSGTASGLTVQSELRKCKYSSQYTSLQAAVTALSAGEDLIVDDDYTLSASVSISNKTDVCVWVRGTLTLSGAASSAKIFDLVGTIDNLTIGGIGGELIGENDTSYTQTAIGNSSGQTISNVWFVNHKISNINVGVSLNAESGGSYTKGHVLNNSFTNMVGVNGGQGYGTHLANATQSEVVGNVYDNCSRHAIYQARGSNVGVTISGNLIKNHRSSVANASIRTAIQITKSSGVLVAYNTNENGSDGGINISHVTSEEESCSDIEVVGNIFRNRQNLVSDMYVGENSVPTDYTTTHIRIRGNKFFSDYGDTSTGADVTVYNGRYIEFDDNTFRKTGVTGTATFVIWGADAAITATADFTDTSASGNRFVAEGNTLTDTRAFSLPSDVSTGLGDHRFDNRKHVGISHPIRHAATPTNPNIMVITEHRARVLSTGAAVADGTTAGKAATGAAARIAYSRVTASKGITDDLWDLTGVSTTAGQFRKVLLCLENGSTARIVVGEVAATQAAAKLPRLPDHRWAALGVVEIGESYSGGDLSGNTFYDIVGHYEQ